MKNQLRFLKEFYQNSGTWILSAAIFNKFILFLIKLFVLLYIEKSVYGDITYAIGFIAFFTPFGGLGSHAGLLRFGSISNDENVRKELSHYSFSAGMIFNLIFILILAPIVVLFADSKAVFIYLIILLVRIISMFLMSFQSAELRVKRENKLFGKVDLFNSLVLLVLAVILTFLFNAVGYVLALVLAPIISFLVYCIQNGFPKLSTKWNLPWKQNEFWSYSFLASFSAVVAQFIFSIDIFLLKYYLDSNAVAEYGAASLIPLNLLIIPAIFMRTDFAKIAENYQNPKFLRSYFYRYFGLFFILCLVGLFLSYFLGEWMFKILGDEYNPYQIFMILMLGAVFSILLRVPLSGMISAVGKTKFNTISGIATLVLAIILNVILIPKYGVNGAAWATTISLLFSGLVSWIYFEYYLKKLN